MQAVFVRVLNLSVSAGYVILAVMAMRLLLRRAPRWAVCALWALAAFRLCCPFTLESALSLLPSRETVNESAILERDSGAPVIQSGFALIDRRANQALAGMTSSPPADRPAAAPSKQAQNAPAPAAEAAAPIVSMTEVLSWIWLAGMGSMLLYGAGSYILLRRRLRTAVRWKEELWQSEYVDAPFVLGVFRPRVYLPFAMEGPAFEQVIAHERAHIRRHDQAIKLLAWLILSVYWFSPLCWAAYWLLGRDIELACDERVIRDLDENGRRGYARALLAWGVTRPKLNACPVAFGEAGLKERIMKVMRYKKPALWATALALTLCAGAAVCLLTVPLAEAAPEPVTVTSAPSEETEAAEKTKPEDRAIQALADQGIDVWQPDGPVNILRAKPAFFTSQQVRKAAETLFSGAEAYEYDPDGKDSSEPARWEYRSVDEQGQYRQMLVRLVLGGAEIMVTAVDYAPTEGAPMNALWLCDQAYAGMSDLTVSSQAANPPDQRPETEAAERYLDELGLEDWSVSSMYMTGAQAGSPFITLRAQPSYDGLPLVDASGLLEPYRPSADTADAYMDEHILFHFTSSGQLYGVEWRDPAEITDREETGSFRTPEDVLALIAEEEADTLGPDAAMDDVARYLHDSGVVSMRLGYLRIARNTTATDVRMVPYWSFLDRNGRLCRLTLAGGAEDVQAPEGWAAESSGGSAGGETDAVRPDSLSITCSIRPGYDYNGNGFWAGAGESYDMDVEWVFDGIEAAPVWSSTDPSVATVDQDGVVTLLAPGDADILVDVNGLRGVCPVHVQ